MKENDACVFKGEVKLFCLLGSSARRELPGIER